MQFHRLTITALIIFMLLCSGCYGSKEPEDIGNILVMGIDQAEDTQYRIIYQTAVPHGPSSVSSTTGMENESGQTSSWVINALLAPPVESRMLARVSTSRFPKLHHIIAIICSESVARQGLGPILANIVRNRDFRERIFLIVVAGSAEQYIKQNKPKLEDNLADFYEVFLTSANESGYFLPATIHDFNTRLKNAGSSPYAVYSGINPMTGENKPAGGKPPEQTGVPYLPGGIPRTGTANPVDFAGLAVFRGSKMVGVLNSDETRAVAILQGRFANSHLGVVDPLQPEKDKLVLKVRTESKPKITARFDNGKPVFDITVKIEGETIGISSGINYEAPTYRELLETQTAKLFTGQIMAMLRHTQELGTDPVGLGLYLRPAFGSTGELTQADMTALYHAADIRLQVTVKIRRNGLELKTSEKRE